jgi:hypothetical protein
VITISLKFTKPKPIRMLDGLEGGIEHGIALYEKIFALLGFGGRRGLLRRDLPKLFAGGIFSGR